MNDIHPLYLDLLKKWIALDTRESLPPAEERIAALQALLEEEEVPVPDIDITGTFDT